MYIITTRTSTTLLCLLACSSSLVLGAGLGGAALQAASGNTAAQASDMGAQHRLQLGGLRTEPMMVLTEQQQQQLVGRAPL